MSYCVHCGEPGGHTSIECPVYPRGVMVVPPSPTQRNSPRSAQEVYEALVYDHAGPALARAIAKYHDLIYGDPLNPWSAQPPEDPFL